MLLADQGAACPAYHLCLQDYLQTQFSPAHLLSELGFTILFDLLLVWLVWGKLIKPYLNRRVNQMHALIDEEHNIEHHDDHVHVTDQPVPAYPFHEIAYECVDLNPTKDEP